MRLRRDVVPDLAEGGGMGEIASLHCAMLVRDNATTLTAACAKAMF